MSRLRDSVRAIPGPLLLLLGVVALFNVAWSITTPALQAPDEIDHWTYVQTLAELKQLPGDEERPIYSSELLQATVKTNVTPTIFWTHADPEWSRPHELRWERESHTYNRTDTGGPNAAWTYPPLYYVWEAAAYRAAWNGDFFTRLTVMRLASSLWLLLNTVAAWLLAGELFRRRSAQLIGAATVGLWPMLSFISASVNPDAALYALSTGALWMGVRVLRRGLTVPRGLALGGLVAAAMLTKAQAVALLPSVLLLLTWAIWRPVAVERRRALLGGLAAVAAIGLSVLGWKLGSSGGTAYSEVAGTVTSGASATFNLREFFSYLWQFYLPRLSFMTEVDHHVPVISDLPLYNTWIGTGWGVFGWVNVWFPDWVYKVFAAMTVVMALLCVGAAVRWWRGDRPDPAPFAFLALTVLVLVAAIHWTDYSFYIDKTKGLFAQGRYLFPLAGAFAMAVAWGLGGLPQRWRGAAAAAWLGGLVVFQLAALGLIVGRWYA